LKIERLHAMNNNRKTIATLPAAVGLTVIALSSLTPVNASAQVPEELWACYIPHTGVVYRVNPPADPGQDPDLRDDCTASRHVKFHWVDGEGADHGSLTGLGDDDHPQYLPRDGSRGMTGKLTTTDKIGIGTATPSSPLTIQPVLGADISFSGGGGFNADILASNEFRVGTLDTSPFSLLTNNMFRLTVTGAGNVGIGTTSPAEKLSVTGVVQSTSGGFKFPDGTVQTTAYTSSGPVDIGWEMVKVQITASSGTMAGYAYCPAGKKVLGGGVWSAYYAGHVVFSEPLSGGNGYRGYIQENTPGSIPDGSIGYVTAVCAQVN
jgi:hypothetical protein